MNTVEIDSQTLSSEALAAVADVPDVAVPGAPEVAPESAASPEEIRQGYEVLFTGMVGWSSQTFAPNWAVTPDETSALSQALAGACMLWFPDQPIPPKYLSLLTVAAAAAQIVAARRDPETGLMKPLRAQTTEATRANEATPS